MTNNYIARKLKKLEQFETMLPLGNIEGKNILLYRKELIEISNELKFDMYEFDIPYYEICKEEKVHFGVSIYAILRMNSLPKYREYCRRESFLMKLHGLIDYLKQMLLINPN
jgi:hypothetical protein